MIGTRAVIAAALSCAGCQGAMDAFFAQDVVDVHADLAYRGTTNPRQALDLYLPRGVDNFPVAVFVHGGYWIGQDKNYFQPVVGLYGNVGQALARRGIGAVVINYRLVPDVTLADQYDDVIQAIAWTEANIADWGGDPSNLFLTGHSAGGHLIALAALEQQALRAAGVDLANLRGAVPLSPILDVADMAANPPSATHNADITTPVFGDDFTTFAPVTYVRPDVMPMTVVMGDDDEPFLLPQLPRVTADLAALGAPVTLVTLPGHSHADIVLRFDGDDDEVTPIIADFIDAHRAP